METEKEIISANHMNVTGKYPELVKCIEEMSVKILEPKVPKHKFLKTNTNEKFKIMNTKNQTNIFIVEDNEMYAKTLQTFIRIQIPNIKEIKTFCIGEMCLMEMDRNPGIVIMDYFLNSKYEEAQNGLEIIKSIKARKPQTKIIMLSDQEKSTVAIEAIKQYNCIYVQKDQEAFNKVAHFIKEVFNNSAAKDTELWN